MGFLRLYVFPIVSFFIFGFIYKLLPSRKKEIMTRGETIEFIKNKKCSVARFGDGEFDILCGKRGPGYQRSNPELKNRLSEVLYSEKKDLLVCLPGTLDWGSFLARNPSSKEIRFWRTFIVFRAGIFYRALSQDRIFGDAFISRPYSTNWNWDESKKYFEEVRQLWNDRDVVVVEGNKTRFGVGNDLLQNSKSVRRIIVPAKNAFDKYEEILSAIRTIPKGTMLLMAVGPMAKILAFDLCQEYWAIDIGHLDVEYEWFVRRTDNKIPIPNKYVNETGRVYFEEGCAWVEEYRSQIIKTIN